MHAIAQISGTKCHHKCHQTSFANSSGPHTGPTLGSIDHRVLLWRAAKLQQLLWPWLLLRLLGLDPLECSKLICVLPRY
jgi:hypothetical protein